MLLNQSSDRIKLIKETAMLEGITQEQFNNIQSPRVLNTHFPFSLLPKEITKHKAKIIFVQRNPKDICVSYYNHHFKILEYGYTGVWDHYVPRFLKGLGKLVNFFLTSGDFCGLLLTFAYSLDPDHERQNVGLDLDPNRLKL